MCFDLFGRTLPEAGILRFAQNDTKIGSSVGIFRRAQDDVKKLGGAGSLWTPGAALFFVRDRVFLVEVFPEEGWDV